ncbi:hypothetical protein JCM10207_001928 [Rhodosporidiobolus poonsookiae]
MDIDLTKDDFDAGDDELTPLQLADGALENVTKCTDCGKPVLPSAMEEHAALCAQIREGRLSEPGSNKRRLSEASTQSSQLPKKSKLVLHLGNDKGKASSGTPEPPVKKNRRVVDVDRQCGVINDKGYPCPRSLTCKTHNMSHKRAVPGRSQPYDILLFEWQKTAKANQKPTDGSAPAKAGTASRPAASTPHDSGTATPLSGDPYAAAAGPATMDPPLLGKSKKKRSGVGEGGVYKLPGEKKGKKGIVYVGEWEESDDDAAADELVDSEEEVEAVLRGIGRIERGRPLFIARGGGAGFSSASMFNGRNQKLLRLPLQDVFRPPLA